MNRIRIGVMGCSRFAIRSMIPAIRELSDRFQLAGIASRRRHRAEECAAPFHAKPFDSYQSLVDAPEIDAVYIPLPNALHAEWTEKALERGLHVLVEKSLVCSYEEAIRVHSMASEKKLILLENFHFRFHRQLAWVVELVGSGRIGAVRCIRSSFGFPPQLDPADIRYQKALGGGALLDAGAYPVKLVQVFMGEDVSVIASRLAVDQAAGVDIWGGAFLAQRRGDLFAEIAFGFDNYYQCSLEVWGSEGKVSTNRIFTCPRATEPVFVIETRGSKEIRQLPADNQIRNMLVHFHDLVRDKGNAETEYEQNLQQARLLNELRIASHAS